MLVVVFSNVPVVAVALAEEVVVSSYRRRMPDKVPITMSPFVVETKQQIHAISNNMLLNKWNLRGSDRSIVPCKQPMQLLTNATCHIIPGNEMCYQIIHLSANDGACVQTIGQQRGSQIDMVQGLSSAPTEGFDRVLITLAHCFCCVCSVSSSLCP